MAHFKVQAKGNFKFKDIEKQILNDFIKKVRTKIDVSLAKGLESQIKEIIKRKLYDSDEARSLSTGKLRAHFGLTDGLANVIAIVNRLAEEVHVSQLPLRVTLNRKVSGGLAISFDLGKAQSILLAMPEARQITAKGETLEWLEWLLVRGKETIIEIKTHFVLEGNFQTTKSRTGDAIMVNGSKTGKTFKVPAPFEGTPTDNWLTRALGDLDKLIPPLVEAALNKIL